MTVAMRELQLTPPGIYIGNCCFRKANSWTSPECCYHEYSNVLYSSIQAVYFRAQGLSCAWANGKPAHKYIAWQNNDYRISLPSCLFKLNLLLTFPSAPPLLGSLKCAIFNRSNQEVEVSHQLLSTI